MLKVIDKKMRFAMHLPVQCELRSLLFLSSTYKQYLNQSFYNIIYNYLVAIVVLFFFQNRPLGGQICDLVIIRKICSLCPEAYRGRRQAEFGCQKNFSPKQAPRAGVPTRPDSVGTDLRPPGRHFIKAIKIKIN